MQNTKTSTTAGSQYNTNRGARTVGILVCLPGERTISDRESKANLPSEENEWLCSRRGRVQVSGHENSSQKRLAHRKA